MEKQIIKKLNQIKKMVETIGIEGQIYLPISNVTVKEFEEALSSITEYPKYGYSFSLSDKFTVIVFLK